MNHFKLILFARALGYKSVKYAGLCRGFSAMWMQAVCCGDLETFNERLAVLDEFSPQRPGKLLKAIKKAQKCENAIGFEALSPRVKALCETQAFFEGIALYLNPFIGYELFGKKFLMQNQVAEISPYLLPSGLEKNQDGITRNVHALKRYDLCNLTQHLKDIATELKDRPDAAILFGANLHSVGVRVLGEDKFELIDTNNLDQAKQTYTSQTLAKKLNKAFGNSSFFGAQKPLVLRTEIYTRKSKPLIPSTINKLTPDKMENLGIADHGITALHYAAFCNDLDHLQRLQLGNDAQALNQRDASGNTALSWAIFTGSKEVCNYLLSFDSLDVNAVVHGKIPFACCIYQEDNDLALQIVDHPKFNARARDTDKWEDSPLHHLRVCKSSHCKNLAEKLIAKGAAIDVRNKVGDTPLISACAAGNTDLVGVLLEHNAALNVQNKKGLTPLHEALLRGYTDIAKQLIEKGVDCSLKAKDNTSALSIACQHHNTSLVPLLLEKTTVSMRDFQSSSPLYKAILKTTPDLQKQLLIKALACYQTERTAQGDYLNPFKLGYSYKQKLDAVAALLQKLKGDESVDLGPHLKALKNGRLANLYKIYTTNLTNTAEAARTQQFKTALEEMHDPDKPSTAPPSYHCH